MLNDNDNGDKPSGESIPLLPFIAVDPLRLEELFLWGQIALDGLQKRPQESRELVQGLMLQGAGIIVTEVDMVMLTARLYEFVGEVRGLINEIKLLKAQAKIIKLTGSKL